MLHLFLCACSAHGRWSTTGVSSVFVLFKSKKPLLLTIPASKTLRELSRTTDNETILSQLLKSRCARRWPRLIANSNCRFVWRHNSRICCCRRRRRCRRRRCRGRRRRFVIIICLLQHERAHENPLRIELKQTAWCAHNRSTTYVLRTPAKQIWSDSISAFDRNLWHRSRLERFDAPQLGRC